MKSTKRLKAISITLLTCLCLQVTPVQSAEIFFTYSTANRMLVDQIYIRKEVADATERLELCNNDRVLLETQADLLIRKVSGLQLDKEVYRKESDRFKDLYVAADKERVEAVNNTPSRIRWFTIGVLTTLITGIAAALSIK